MNKETEVRALEVWKNYLQNGEIVKNVKQEYTSQEFKDLRNQIITEIQVILNNYFEGLLPLEEFKMSIDSINKRYPLWGFKGINGQMFFNVLTKTCISNNLLIDLDNILKQSLKLPQSPDTASFILDKFAKFTKNLSKFFEDLRVVPKVGSITFFLSYFWQIQDPLEYPVYYRSQVEAFREKNIWFPKENIGDTYVSFHKTNHELRELFSRSTGRDLNLWDVEHAFWFILNDKSPEVVVTANIKDLSTIISPIQKVIDLPESFIPPIVSILPNLALNDPYLAEMCLKKGRSIEKVFEDRIDILLKMLGFDTEVLGQGHGRVPDGVAISREFRYAIVYDAKVRQSPYTMGTDERAIKEYIINSTDRLRKQGIRFIYFMIVSSSFSGDHDDVIRNLKMETDAREILLVEAVSLISLLEAKLKDPTLTLGPDGIQRLFANSGILRESDVKEFQGL